MLIIIIRLVMSWFSSQQHNEKGVLAKLCDPYLNLFKKIPFFTIGYIDFSPIIALAVLVITANILNQFGMAGTISFGMVLAVVIRAIWSALSSLMFFIFIIALIRFIIALVKPNAYSPILVSLDSLLNPVTAKVSSLFSKNNNYTANLMLFCIVLIVVYFAGNFLINQIAGFALRIPF